MHPDAEYITKIHVGEIEVSELDIENVETILGKDFYDKSAHYSYIEKTKKSTWGGEQEPIAINKLLPLINRLKNKGATHIEVMYHIDHQGYVLNGYTLRKSTTEESDEEKRIWENQKETLKQLDELEKQKQALLKGLKKA
jgi:hypothetical protein